MNDNLRSQLALLPDYLGNHLLISVIALAIGIAISLPLAIFAARRKAFQAPVLTFVGIIQTIPSLALLALMVPLFVLLGKTTHLNIPAFGLWPAVVALTLYSMLPIVRNTVTGIAGVDRDLIEAARGVGMTPRQQLMRVELPLAAPVIIAGIRTATVWVVGIATLSTPVGQTSLGNYIFSGLQTQNWTAVVVGCISAALLAIVLDALIGLLEKASAKRSRPLALGALAGLAFVIVAGLTPLVAQNIGRLMAAPSDKGAVVMVGAKTFTEQYILSELIQQKLRADGFRAESKESLGSTVVFDALAANQIDVYVDYSGTIWSTLMKRKTTPDAQTVLDEMKTWLQEKHKVVSLGSLGFENAYALAMRRDRAEKLGIKTIADLTRQAPQMNIGSDYEFFSRPDWKKVRDTYGLRFSKEATFDPTFLYDAVKNKQADVITAYSSDGRIAAYDLVVLKDPRHAFPPYDAVILLSPNAAKRPELVKAMRELVGKISVEKMRAANQLVDVEKKPANEAAKWLLGQIK